jgi:hypothetical protein
MIDGWMDGWIERKDSFVRKIESELRGRRRLFCCDQTRNHVSLFCLFRYVHPVMSRFVGVLEWSDETLFFETSK